MRRFRAFVVLACLLPSMLSAQTADRARALIARVTEETFGGAKIDQVQSLREKTIMTFPSPAGEQTLEGDLYFMLPDSAHMEMLVQGTPMTMVTTSRTSFVQAAGRIIDMTPVMAEDIRNNMRRNVFLLLHHAHDPDFRAAIVGSQTIGDVDTTILEVRVGNEVTQLYVEESTGRVYGESFRSVTDHGPVQRDIVFSDWRLVEGFSTPFQSDVMENGIPTGHSVVLGIELNPEYDPGLFQRPPKMLPQPYHPARALLSVPKVFTQPESQPAVTAKASAPVPVPAKTATPAAGSDKPLSIDDIEPLLRLGVKKRVSDLIEQYGVDFGLSDGVEKRLRTDGADDALLLRIAKNRKR
jgi:hypothetical protein